MDNNTAQGSVLLNGQPISITMTANYTFDLTPEIFNYGKFSGYSGSKPPSATVPRTNWSAGVGGTTTMTFSQKVENPVLLLASLGGGNPNPEVVLTFSQPYEVVYDGGEMVFTNNTTIKGNEGFAIIKFPGDFTSVTIYSSTPEVYTNITWGVYPPSFKLSLESNPADGNLCIGSPVTLTASGASSYRWNTQALTPAISVTPTTTTTYTVTGTDANGCISTKSALITVKPLPNINIAATLNGITTNNVSSICAGSPVTLTASGATNYSWNTQAITPTISVFPNTTTNYTVSGTDVNGCVNSKNITVNPLPNIVITETDNSGNTPNDSKLCVGGSVTLTASGGISYSWVSEESSTTITKNPSITTVYSVVGADLTGCINTATHTVTVNALPVINIAKTDNSGTVNNDGIICIGSIATLTASGAASYLWNSSEITAAINKSPLTTSAYTVTGTDAFGCVASQNATITVNSLPTVSLGNVNFCPGAAATLNAIASPAGNYAYYWTVPTGVTSPGNVASFSTNKAGNYKVYITNTNTNCQSAEVTGIVNTILPISGITSVCVGAQTQLTGSGTPIANNPWVSSSTAKATVSNTGLVTGISAGTTNITYSNTLGCSTTSVITVNALPTISGTIILCSGSQSQLTGSGTAANTNAWTSSNTATATVSSSGLVTGVEAGTTSITYTNSNGCSVSTAVTVNVQPSISGVLSVCAGSQTQLTGSGTPAISNPWISASNAKATVSNTGLVTGIAAGISTITYTNSVGCSITAVVTVNAVPIISGPLSVCSESQIQLTGSATAATNNAWVIGNIGTAIVSSAGLVTGIAAGTSTITYTNSFGCSQSAVVTVNALPAISGLLTVCKGSQIQLTGSVTAATNNPWISSSTTKATVSNTGLVTGIQAGSSTITYTNSFGCTQTAIVTVKPLPEIANVDISSCTGSLFGYNPTNGLNGDIVPTNTSYSWANPTVTSDVTGGVAGTNSSTFEGNLVNTGNFSKTAIYFVTPTAEGCVGNNFRLTVTVNPIPTTPVIIASGFTTFCVGGSVDFTSTYANGNQWFKNGVAINSATGPKITVTDSGIFTVVVSSNGCKSAPSLAKIVTVNLLPVISIASVPDSAALCAGFSATLTASGAAVYFWSGGVVNGVPFVPIQTTTYTVNGMDVNGCTSSKTATIKVYPIPAKPLVSNNTYCQNDFSSPLQAISVNSNIISWYQQATGGLSIARPTPNTSLAGKDTFYVTQKTIYGCESPRASLFVTVNPLPIDSIAPPAQNFICNGSTLVLNATNSYTYQWLNNGLPVPGATANNYSAKVGGVYSFVMTNQFGCLNKSSNTETIQLIEKPKPNFNFDNRCQYTPIKFINTSNFDNSGTVLWKWYFGNGDIATIKEGQYAYQTSGNFTVTLSATPSNCPQLADTSKKAIVIEAPIKGINYGIVDAKSKVAYSLKARDIGTTYLWSPSTGLSSTTIPNPTTLLTSQQFYTIRISNAAGCVTNDSIQVRVFNEYTVFVPSGFSPDGDGINEKLSPLLAGIKELKSFRVYNRWGQLLYQSSDKNAGWNGTFNGKLQLSETYVWVVEAVDQDGKNILKTGKTTLIR
jgi:gliding motility-associated-like protein